MANSKIHDIVGVLLKKLSQKEIETLIKWKDKANNKASLLTFLNQITLFKECYSTVCPEKNVTIFQDAVNALGRAEKYKPQFVPLLSTLVWEEFLLFLAIYHLGQGVAKNTIDQYPTKKNSFSDKICALEINRLIVKAILNHCTIPLERQNIYCGLLKKDLIEDYLNEQSSQIQTLKECFILADKLKIEELNFLNLFITFHQCIATPDILRSKNNQLGYCPVYEKKIDALQKEVALINTGKNAYLELLAEIKSKNKTPDVIEQKFGQNFNSLIAFLQREHSRLLTAKVDKAKRAYFSNIKKGFGIILRELFLVEQDNTPVNKKIDLYKKALVEGQLGCRKFNIHPPTPSLFWFRYDPSLPNIEILGRILQKFRRDFHVRYSPMKISKAVAKNENIVAQGLEDYLDLLDYLPLLDIVFLHGTNSNILPNLLLTDLFLKPSGKLIPLGVIPLSGELGRGATCMGVNAERLSGVDLDDAKTAKEYSKSFKVEPDKIINRLDEFIKAKNSYFDKRENKIMAVYDISAIGGEEISNISYVILQARLIQKTLKPYNEAEFQQKIETLILLHTRIKTAFQEYKKGDDYRTHMPKSKNRNFGHHDEYYESIFIIFEKALESLHYAITTEKLCLPEPKDLNLISFPIIIASSNLPVTHNPDLSDAELFSHIPLRLGSMIKHLFVETENINQMKEWLVEHGLDHKVKVYNMALLNKITKLNVAASPYLADILSVRKLEHLKDSKLFKPLNLEVKLNKRALLINKTLSFLQKGKQFIENNRGSLGCTGIFASLVAYYFPLSLPLLGTLAITSFSLFKITEKLRELMINKIADTQAKRAPHYDKDSIDAVAYQYGRDAQKSWKTYFASYRDRRAYNMKPYYLGKKDEENNVLIESRINLTAAI